MRRVKVCVLRAAGINCDKETAFAFSKVGAEVDSVHVNNMVSGSKKLADYQILALPGGFSYGDDIASGKIFANELRCKLADELAAFVKDGKLIIGICNGFQVLVKSGLLPGNSHMQQEASLIINDSGKFEDRWVYLKNSGRCIWTKKLPKLIYLPVAHGEGKFIVKDKGMLKRFKDNGQIVFQYSDAQGHLAGYPDNPNGAVDNIAGICDVTGRILGLMPHPERHIEFSQHPRWFGAKGKRRGDGLQIFENGVKYAKKIL
jgi:phosphoribosylformylglycinamidine synthase